MAVVMKTSSGLATRPGRRAPDRPFRDGVMWSTKIFVTIRHIGTFMPVTRSILNMRDKHDHVTLNLLSDEAAPQLPSAPVPKIGRPRKEDALSDAERARRYRARKKARLAELKDISRPLRSTVIDLSALAPWKRVGG